MAKSFLCYFFEYIYYVDGCYLTGDTRKIFVSNIRPSTSPTRRASSSW